MPASLGSGRASLWPALPKPTRTSASRRPKPVQNSLNSSQNLCKGDIAPKHMTRLAERVRHRDLEAQSLIPKAGGAQNEVLYSASDKPHSLTPVLFAVFWASMGAFNFGYHLGVVNGPLAALAAELGFASNAGLQGMVVSSCLAGGAVGSLSGSGLADSFGRKKTLIFSALPTLLGALLSATATSLHTMVAGRILVGIGIGLSSALVPLYISEISPAKVRGTLGSLNQLVICIGILFALLTNTIIPAAQWRTMFYIAAAPAALLGLGMSVSPESPRWQYSKGDSVAAMASATKLWGSQGPASLEEGSQRPGDSGQKDAVSLRSLFQCKGVLIGVLLFVAQQLSGINAVVYFSSATFQEAGVQSGELASAVVGTINVLGTILAASVIEKFGRKQLLSVSFSGMGACMLIMSAGLGLASLAGYRGTIALLGTILYVGFFSLGAGAVPGLLVPEITPARLRGKAVSLALAAHWIFNFGIGQLFLPAVSQVGLAGVYLFFAAVCGVTVLYTKSQVVETKGLSLEEIEKLLE